MRRERRKSKSALSVKVRSNLRLLNVCQTWQYHSRHLHTASRLHGMETHKAMQKYVGCQLSPRKERCISHWVEFEERNSTVGESSALAVSVSQWSSQRLELLNNHQTMKLTCERRFQINFNSLLKMQQGCLVHKFCTRLHRLDYKRLYRSKL